MTASGIGGGTVDQMLFTDLNVAWIVRIAPVGFLLKQLFNNIAENYRVHTTTLRTIEKAGESWAGTCAYAINLASRSRNWRTSTAEERQEIAVARGKLHKEAFSFRKEAAAAAMQRRKAWKPYWMAAQHDLWEGVRSEFDLRAQNLKDSATTFKELKPIFPNRGPRSTAVVRSVREEFSGEGVEGENENDNEDGEEMDGEEMDGEGDN